MLSRRDIIIGATSLAAVGTLGRRAWAQEQRPLKIGVLTDMNSAYADQTGAGALAAVKMACADFGPVFGHPVEVIAADTQLKADVAATIARRWWDTESVDAICDIGGSAVALAVMQISAEKKKIALAGSPGSSDITGKLCSPYTTQWSYDTYAVTKVLSQTIMQQGGDTWFFIAADYAFGTALVADATAVIQAKGGKVLGQVKAPLGTSDFSSYLLQAQSSGAKVIALANGGTDTINAIKQATEFGIQRGGQRVAALVMLLTDVHAIGLEMAQGTLLSVPFYWDRDAASRIWSQRFFQQVGRMPTYFQAGDYSQVTHYLKAVTAAGTRDADAVTAKMRELPVKDLFTADGVVRKDGRMVHQMFLAQVKTPAESKGEWDLLKILTEVPGDQAFRPLSEGGCPLVRS